MRYAYNSNGLKLHSPAEAVGLLAELGYDGLELALQRQHLHPLETSAEDVRALRAMLHTSGLGVVCGAGVPDALGKERFEPSLFHPDPDGRGQRQQYLRASLEMAAELGSQILVFCSGSLKAGVERTTAWDWLVEGVRETCRRAAELGLGVAVEPEPGHFVESLDDYRRLRAEVEAPNLGITADVGHIYCTEDGQPEAHLGRLLREERLLHVQIEDMRGRRHAHLPFGEGEINFPPVLRVLSAGGYGGFIGVELSRDSQRAADLAERSLEFLKGIESTIGECHRYRP